MLKLPSWKLSVFGLDPDRTAVATGRDLAISPKHAREIAKAIRGMALEDGQEYLESVMEQQRSVPFRRHRKKVGHRKDLIGWPTGRYPVKAATEINKVLKNAENNAIFKGLEVSSLRIAHIIAHRGRKIKGIFPRAQGRSSPKVKTLAHIEVVLEEE